MWWSVGGGGGFQQQSSGGETSGGMFFFREFFKSFIFLFLPRDKRRWIKVGGDKSELLFFPIFSGGGGDSSSFVSFLKGRRSAPSIHLKNFYFFYLAPIRSLKSIR